MAYSKGVTGWVMVAGCAFVGSTAFAAHPLQTEDTGTQGAGNVEVEHGLSWFRTDGAKVFTYQPQVSYGGSSTFDLIVQPSWLSSRDEGSPSARGWGDTNLDAKWRFFGEAPLSLAVRAGAARQRSPGVSHGGLSAHALLAATFDAAPFTMHGNLGLTRNPSGTGERSYTRRVSGALLWAVNERLVLAVDGGAETNPNPARSSWLATVLVGVIYTLRPGLDVDIGCQSRVRAPALTHEWLFGITYRFAP